MRTAYFFRGSVQGVGFRATARSVAGRHRVTGFVRNEQDGSVYLEVQGGAAEVEAYIAALKAAMGGLIRSHEGKEVPESDGEASFEIRRGG